MQIELYKSWLCESGISQDIVSDLKRVEVSPLFAIDKEEFKTKISGHLEAIEKRLKGREEYYFG
jgi:hypothetical protein